MEVTTVSPSPVSSTEGDDQCETGVTDVATHSVTLLVCLCGLAGNGAVLWVLRFHTHRDTMKPITAYILDLAIINFLFLIFIVPSTLLFLLEDFSCSSIMPPASIRFLSSSSGFYSVRLYRLTAISIKRGRSMLCPPGLFCHLPQDLSWVVVSATLWALSITAIAAISAVNSLCQSQEHKLCRGALISLYILNFLVFAPSMLISSTILFIDFKASSQQQQSKSLDIIVFLAVLLTLPLTLWNFLQQLSYTTVSPWVVLLPVPEAPVPPHGLLTPGCPPGATSHCLPSIHPSMEVSIVSPLFTSPSNGPGQCEINVSSVAMHIVTLLVGLCGLAGNGVFLWLLHINAITDFIFNQAITDFLFLIMMVPSTLLFLVEEVSCSAIMPQMYLSLLFQLSLFSYNMGLYRLTFISIERCSSVLCLVFCGCQFPERLLRVLMSVLFWAFLFIVIAVSPTETSQCQSLEQEQCQVALTSMYALNLFLFAVPMVISSTILFIHLKPGSQQQQQHKRLDIVIFLVALFSLPLSLWFLLQQLGYRAVPSQVVFLLTCITSSTKPFIYFLLGSWKRDCFMRSCWRHCSMESCRKHSSMQALRKAIHRVFEEPEENTACSNGPGVIRGVQACETLPLHC
ncbi:LOW QUALITY PROTEIN: uncharacterized protein GJ701_006284 [Geothlypis trichas]